jgi:chromosome partitioning protein
VKTIAFFNNKGGVGKTSLVYHMAWMFSELGIRVIAVDLDPQSNLTAAFLSEERIEQLWWGDSKTVLGAVQPLIDRLGDLKPPHIESIDGIGLIAGDLGLSSFEDRLAAAWPACLDDNAPNAHDAFRVITAFHRITQYAASAHGAELALIDVGPNLGAINRAALVSADYVVIPLAADLFSLRELRNLGPALRDWRQGWQTRKQGKVPPKLDLPAGQMQPVGYVILQHVAVQGRTAKAHQQWIDRIPGAFHKEVLGESLANPIIHGDPYQLASLKHYRSLMPMAQEARKPIFDLKPADGALGSHASAVRDYRIDFEKLTRRVADACGIPVP